MVDLSPGDFLIAIGALTSEGLAVVLGAAFLSAPDQILLDLLMGGLLGVLALVYLTARRIDHLSEELKQVEASLQQDELLQHAKVWERGSALIDSLPKGSTLYVTNGLRWEPALTANYETSCQKAMDRDVRILRLFGDIGLGTEDGGMESRAHAHLEKRLCTQARLDLADEPFPIYGIGVSAYRTPLWVLLWITWDAKKSPYGTRLALLTRNPKILATLMEDFETRWSNAKEVPVTSENKNQQSSPRHDGES
jgi:hypothetical protein